ncbi:MAG: hypothetical protein HW407_762, partial [Bacteroidetes bacterium]|nr:hypothetical protein [Bacteroidota bacterium]
MIRPRRRIMKMHVLIVILLPFLVIRAHGEQQQSMKGTVPALIGDSLSPPADISNLIRSAGVSKPFVQIMVNAVSRDSLVETIGALQSFGTRYEFTPQRDEAAEFILDKFKSWGLQAESDRFVVGRGLFYSFNDMDISGADTAWLAMYYSILRTTDGGNTWTSSSGPLGYMNAIGIDFINSREGWVVGEPRAILHTTDGGSTWELQNQFLSEGLQHVGFSDLSNGIAVGTGGRVIRTTDGGVSWITANSGTMQDLLRVKVLDNTHAWSVGGGGTILFSGNGGSTWTVQATGITTKISGIDFVDERHGWAAPAKGAMLKTTDGGTTWAKKGLDTQCWKSISFVDTLLGYATDCSGNILKTTDGGESWNLSLPSLQAGWHPMLNAVRAFGKQRIFACGERSTIFTSTNQGTTWTNQIANLPEEFIHRTRNIVATIPGSITPEKECVIVAHYDSYSYDMFMPYDIVPGAND